MKVFLNQKALFLEELLRRLRSLDTDPEAAHAVGVDLETDTDDGVVVWLITMREHGPARAWLSFGGSVPGVRVTYHLSRSQPMMTTHYNDANWLSLFDTIWPELERYLRKT